MNIVPVFLEELGDINRKVILQRNFAVRKLVDLCENGIESVGYIRKDRWDMIIAEGHERKVQDLVRTVGHDQVILTVPSAFQPGASAKFQAVRIGIQVQFPALLSDRVRHFLQRGIRVLIGVQLDVFLIPGLFTGNIGHQVFHFSGNVRVSHPDQFILHMQIIIWLLRALNRNFLTPDHSW